MDDTEKSRRLELMKQIRDEVVALTDSPLYAYRVRSKNLPVIGEGNHFAKFMFVGEAPGRNEALQGRPFCGAAGKVLDELLASIALPRESIYVTNIVKDRPPENRDPLPEEIMVYGPLLDRQIDIIRPLVIVTLGRFSMTYIMKEFRLEFDLQPISRIHGKVFVAEAAYGSIHIVPLYHPAVAVYNNTTKDTLLLDFQVLKGLM